MDKIDRAPKIGPPTNQPISLHQRMVNFSRNVLAVPISSLDAENIIRKVDEERRPILPQLLTFMERGVRAGDPFNLPRFVNSLPQDTVDIIIRPPARGLTQIDIGTLHSALQRHYPTILKADGWNRFWGGEYDEELPVKRVFRHLVARWDDEGIIGDLICEPGAGKSPISNQLYENPGRRILAIDIGLPQETVVTKDNSDRMYVRSDIMRFPYTKGPVVSQLTRFLGLAPLDGAYAIDNLNGKFDTFIISDILNYLSFTYALSVFDKMLKPGGRLLILHRKNQESALAHTAKPHSNEELVEYLQAMGYQIEFINPQGIKHGINITYSADSITIRAKKPA